MGEAHKHTEFAKGSWDFTLVASIFLQGNS